jgi:hypothetical protein
MFIHCISGVENSTRCMREAKHPNVTGGILETWRRDVLQEGMWQVEDLMCRKERRKLENGEHTHPSHELVKECWNMPEVALE